MRNPERPDGQWRWPGVIRVLTEWARDFHFRTTPDQWEQNALRRQLVKVDDPSGGDNTPFTEAERAEIAAQLRAIEADLREQGKLTEGIKAALGEAREASNRLGRKDWKNWFLGTVTALLVAGNVDRDVANHVLVFILRGLAHLFGHGGPPPMLGH